MIIDLYKQDLEGVLDIEQYCKDNNIDAKEVKYLDCSDNEITEIKGLDKLVNLEWLWCRNNKLTKLDLSKLVNLKTLYCHNNKLSELDVTNLVNLKTLDCKYNKLTELKGLDKLVNLKWLYCRNNELSELDLSKLVNLEWFDCDNNELTEIKGSHKLINLKVLNSDEYIQPEPEQDKLDLLISKVEKLEQIISEITKGK